MAQNVQQELSVEDLKKQGHAIGEKIALLLKEVELPAEIKAGIVEIIPFMTLQQINELVMLLEDRVGEGLGLNAKLIEKYSELKKEYDFRKENLAEKAMDDLDSIEQMLE